MRLHRLCLACGLSAVLLAACGEAEPPPAPAAAPAVVSTSVVEAISQQGGFHLRVLDAPKPIPQNTLQAWTLRLTDSTGQAVVGAHFGAVTGGMPAHGHGFPTAPQVTERGGGDYRIEGLKFHMAGEWELRLTFEVGGQQDSVMFKFTLP